MKKPILTLFALSILTNIFAQSTHYTLSLNSGLFSFSGKSAEKSSFINYNSLDNSGYTNNPYGSKSGLCYGVSATINRVTKNNFQFGAIVGTEVLRSQIEIDGISERFDTETVSVNAKGQTYLNYNFINIYPNLGYLLKAGKYSFDITGGFDVAYCLDAKEKGRASTFIKTYETSRDRRTIQTEVRPRIQISAYYKIIGVYFGYSKGIKNYKAGYVGGTNEVYGKLYRFGLNFRIK